jgi:peptidyl-prolyl cis-trans isomerase A (cyclophilin A)
MRKLASFLAAVAVLGACGSQQPREALLRPVSDQRAPDTFDVSFETSQGRFVVRAVRAWAPLGVDRFHHLVSVGYYDRVKFFRSVPNFVVQFGLHGDPEVTALWRTRTFPDDSVVQSNVEGFVTFAKGGPNTRTTQLYINRRDNSRLDTLGFAPIGRVTSGMSVVHALYSGYGESPPRGGGPEQGRIVREGNRYLEREFPRLDSIIRARIVRD